MVIWPEFRVGQNRYGDHREDASHFSLSLKTSVRKSIWVTSSLSIRISDSILEVISCFLILAFISSSFAAIIFSSLAPIPYSKSLILAKIFSFLRFVWFICSIRSSLWPSSFAFISHSESFSNPNEMGCSKIDLLNSQEVTLVISLPQQG